MGASLYQEQRGENPCQEQTEENQLQEQKGGKERQSLALL
jgi:hypothetical protein